MGGILLVARADGKLQSSSDFKSEELSSFCEARCYTLHGRLSMGNKVSVISGQKLPDQFLLVFVWACKRLRLNRQVAPASMTCWSIMLKNKVKRVGARRQPCFMPFVIF